METVVAFGHGFILALGLILPLGVQNVFVFSQGACQPKLSRTLPVVLTAGVCDTLLILVAVLGVSVAVLNFLWLKLLLLRAGVVFLGLHGLDNLAEQCRGRSRRGQHGLAGQATGALRAVGIAS